MNAAVKGLWNIVLSGYPRAGKSILATRLIADNSHFARIGVDELRAMFFGDVYPCRDEFLIYSMIGDMRDALLEDGYSVVIDSTAPDNVTRQFLLTTKVKPVNKLLLILNVDRKVLIQRNIEKFGDTHAVLAYDKCWEEPETSIPVFKFKSNSNEEFEAYYARLIELLESETHPFKPEFHPHLPIRDIRKTLRNILKMH
jgi:predicted kinase